jgi:hypothetical protein
VSPERSWRRTTRRSSQAWSSSSRKRSTGTTPASSTLHDVDEVIHRYHEATCELWKFCFRGGSGAYIETVPATLERLTAVGARPDWWAAAERAWLGKAGSRSRSSCCPAGSRARAQSWPNDDRLSATLLGRSAHSTFALVPSSSMSSTSATIGATRARSRPSTSIPRKRTVLPRPAGSDLGVGVDPGSVRLRRGRRVDAVGHRCGHAVRASGHAGHVWGHPLAIRFRSQSQRGRYGPTTLHPGRTRRWHRRKLAARSRAIFSLAVSG